MKHFVFCVLALACLAGSAWSLDDAAIQAKIKELMSEDPKVRSAAVKELAPLFADLVVNLTTLRDDNNREVTAAMSALDKEIEKKMLTLPQIPLSTLATNELNAARGCKAFAEAQEVYHRTDWDADGILEYSQAFKGDASLLDKKAGDGLVSLIDKSFADAGDGPAGGKPMAGYYFKLLTKQGAHKNRQAQNYVTDGKNMMLGYACIAYPAVYGPKGKNCFMISHVGTIYQKDLGPDTLKLVEQITEFNPETWTPAE
jgi:hypothetical protein